MSSIPEPIIEPLEIVPAPPAATLPPASSEGVTIGLWALLPVNGAWVVYRREPEGSVQVQLFGVFPTLPEGMLALCQRSIAEGSPEITALAYVLAHICQRGQAVLDILLVRDGETLH